MSQAIDNLERDLAAALGQFPEIELAFLFGSCGTGRQTPESDLDVAVAAVPALSREKKQMVADALADRFERPVDLVDLEQAPPPLLREILVGGRAVLRKNNNLMADFILRLWHNESDLMPCYRQAQRERQEAFANG
jgi:predicted nucleotidyltransferase